MISATMPKPHDSPRHASTLKLHQRTTSGEVSSAPIQRRSPANLPFRDSGTGFAILGVPPNLPCRTGRGGARNHASRESESLSVVNVDNLIAATRHASAIGLTFTRAICIHWQAAGLALDEMASATGQFLDLLTKWLMRRDCRTAWVWVHENGDGKGGHCHLLVHVPAEHVKALTGLVKGWLRRITGNPYRARVIYSRPIGKRLGNEASDSSDHTVNLQMALAYILKGASAEAASQFSLDRLERGGRIQGRRCSTSQNIGRAARQRWQGQ